MPNHFSDINKNFNLHFFPNLSLNVDDLKQLFEFLPIGVMAVDKDKRIVYYNRAHAKLDQLNTNEVLGRVESEVFGYPDFSPGITRACQKMNRPILGYMCPYFTRKNPSRIINGVYWVFPLHGAQNQVSGSICFTMPMDDKDRLMGNKYLIWPDYKPLVKEAKVIVGEAESMLKAVSIAQNKADSPSPVLISGETGTGKELFARMIHDSSHRAGKSFMAINCAAIPSNLLEGLLFGTMKGSFTGALDKPGLFEEANGGTVYLDEVDSMPIDLQPKLLRVLQEMTVRRLGGTSDIKLDVKIISSIGTSVKELINQEKLRSDLFYRLAVIVINVPPLRERLEDLSELINYFINKYNKQLHKKVIDFDDQTKRWILNYSWPGNVRELENLVAGSINMVEDDLVITMEHLPEHYVYLVEQGDGENSSQKAASLGVFDIFPSNPLTYQDTLDSAQHQPDPPQGSAQKSSELSCWHIEEMETINHHLKEARGKLKVAAETLGISRQLLSYKMKKYNLSRYDFLPKVGN